MIRVREAVVVEGRYDKIRLSGLIDGLIVTTDGFGIFHDPEKMAMLRHLAETRGLVVLTDSDGAGFVIRSHLNGCLPPDRVRHAYIPDIPGKERRKTAPSKEGKLGVEGMSADVLLEALRRAGVTCEEDDAPARDGDGALPLTQADFYRAGLSGGAHSAARRAALLAFLGLPARMSARALLGVINDYMTRAQFEDYIAQNGTIPPHDPT